MVKKSIALLLMLGAVPVPQALALQTLLQEDFEAVTGLTAAGTVRTVQSILSDIPNPLPDAQLPTFSNVGNGNASQSSFNVRRGDNAIDGSGIQSPNFGDTDFDNAFNGSLNQFLVIGDNLGNLSDAPNGGTTSGSSSTMEIKFSLDPALGAPLFLTIEFDYVFDANNTFNLDDFVAALILADNSSISLLNFAAPSVTSRGTLSMQIPFPSVAPKFLSFKLTEYGGTGSSAVGIDNIVVTAIPEPATLTLFGLGLLGLGGALRRQKI